MKQWATVSVCVEHSDGSTTYHTWTGRTISRIRRAAKTHYLNLDNGAKVFFGNGYYQQSYGAH